MGATIKTTRMILATLGFISTLVLLALGCYAAASDAQGAVVFIFILPICFGITFLIWVTSKTLPLMRKIAAAFFLFFVLFSVTAFFPKKLSIPNHLIGAVSNVFESVTGESPYAYQRRINDAGGAIRKVLADKGAGPLDLSKLELGQSWDSICVLSSTMTDEEASRLLKRTDWHYSMYRTNNKSAEFTLVMMDNGKDVRYVIHLLKTEFDFTEYTGRCFSKGEAIFPTSPSKEAQILNLKSPCS